MFKHQQQPYCIWLIHLHVETHYLQLTGKRYVVQLPPFLVTINLHVIYIILKSALEHDHVKYHLQDIYIVHGKISVPRKLNLQSSNTTDTVNLSKGIYTFFTCFSNYKTRK